MLRETLSSIKFEKKKGFLSNIKDAYKYPGRNEADKIFLRISPLILAFELTSMTNFPMFLAAVSLLPVPFVLSKEVGKRVRKNEKPYGKILTVQKVAMNNKSFIAQAVPELRHARYLGELHFVGKIGDRKPFPRNKIEVTREAFRGFYKLAQACQGNGKFLKGVDVFAGVSPIIDKRLEAFGFNVLKDNTKSQFYPWEEAIYNSLVPDSRPGLEVPDKKSMIGYITREKLIANKDIYRKFGHME